MLFKKKKAGINYLLIVVAFFFLHSYDASADTLLKDQNSCHLLKCAASTGVLHVKCALLLVLKDISKHESAFNRSSCQCFYQCRRKDREFDYEVLFCMFLILGCNYIF